MRNFIFIGLLGGFTTFSTFALENFNLFRDGEIKLPDEGKLLRIFVGESDIHKGISLYEAIVLKARELNLAGATVFRGIMGYGASSSIHSIKLLRLSEDLPVMIEIVDSEDNINKILPFLDETVHEGLITIEKVTIIK